MDQITRRAFLRRSASGVAAGAFLPITGWSAEKETKRPDVLFIAIEDFSPKRLGCYGNKVCKTPAIDRFASQGLRFTNAHTNPLCGPSRTALLLAQRPETTGVFGNPRKPVDNAYPMPRYMKEQGYETIRCGKIQHGNYDEVAGWDRVIEPGDGIQTSSGKVEKRGPAVEGGGGNWFYGFVDGDDLSLKDGGVAEQGVRILQENREGKKPLLLCLGFHATHLPFMSPKKYFDMYPPEKMEIPRNPGADESGMPPEGVFKKGKPHTLKQWREAIAAQYACLSFIDAQIGRVLDALEKSGRADNTIVVIWSDHGFMLGEHFKWNKMEGYNESTKVALLMRAPGVTKAGTVCDRPVESIDIFPTIIDQCGLPQPKGIEAISMKPLLLDPQRAWKKGALMWCGGSPNSSRPSIVTDRYRYTGPGRLNRSGGYELYDHEKDPNEFVNLADKPEMAEVRKELSALLKGGWKACLPEDYVAQK